MTLELPRAAILSAWVGAWLRGGASSDDLLAHVDAGHEHMVQVVTGLPDADGALPLGLALGTLRHLGISGVASALPAPGDPVGLRGPAAFNAAALEAGEAVLFEGTGVGPDAVLNVRHRTPAPLPGATSDRDRESVERALLCLDIVGLARTTPAGALTAADMRRRDVVLDSLDRAARRTLVATCR